MKALLFDVSTEFFFFLSLQFKRAETFDIPMGEKKKKKKKTPFIFIYWVYILMRCFSRLAFLLQFHVQNL